MNFEFLIPEAPAPSYFAQAHAQAAKVRAIPADGFNVNLRAQPLAPSEESAGTRKFIARQPVFDRDKNIFGYELLFRASLENYFGDHDTTLASQQTVDTYLLYGVQELTGGKRAFINCAREDLLLGYPALLPAETTVIELLENVVADPPVLAACKKLKDAGYLLALDDFAPSPQRDPLAGLADFLKIDLRVVPPANLGPLVQRFGRPTLSLVAEKVETPQEFALAARLGFQYFQGYFFARPQVHSTKDVPAFKLNYLRLLRAANRSALSLREVEEIVRIEPSLLYRLLRYLNSAVFGFRREITSLRHALTLLGESNLKKWISLVAVSTLAGDKPVELIVSCLVRARACELLAPRVAFAAQVNELFLLGLFSAMDAVLDRPMAELLDELPLPDPVRGALLGEQNCHRDLLVAVLAYEKGDWKRFAGHCARIRLAEDDVPPLYLDSVEWSRQALSV